MPSHLIEFELIDGVGYVVVEMDEPVSGVTQAARPGEVAAKASQTFEDAMDRIRPIATTLVSKVRDLADPPDEAEFEFGLKLTAEAGAILTSAGGEAHCKVTLTWKRNEKNEMAAIEQF